MRLLLSPRADAETPGIAEIVAQQVTAALAADADWSGLFGAWRDDSSRVGAALAGAVWLQYLPGRTASFLGPRVTSDTPAATLDALLSAALATVDFERAALVQALLPADDAADADEGARFSRHGFTQAAELLYLVSERHTFPTAPPAGDLSLRPYTPDERPLLARLIEQSYEATRDCPTLNGLRATDDVLDGYQAIGEFDPQRWLIATHADRDVGCLLLADHPHDDMGELVYLGIIPTARGHGWGRLLTQHAQWLARQSGRQKLVLAVDAHNEPARQVYKQCGFQPWDRRTVWIVVPKSA